MDLPSRRWFPLHQPARHYLGHIALNQIKTTGEGGRGLAIAALVIGYVSIAFAVILMVVAMSSAAANR